MKANKFYILLISMLLSTQLFAGPNTFKERSESWLQQSENGGAGTGTDRPGIGGDDKSPDSPGIQELPVGDALVPILLFALAYGACRQIRTGSKAFRRPA
jgi:hypothetical protein